MALQRDSNKFLISRNKLLDAYTEGECLSLDELKKRMHILNQKIQQIERELAILKDQTDNEAKIKDSRLTLEKFAESLDNSSASLSIEEKQRVVRALIHEVVIHEDSINIRHCIPTTKNSNTIAKKCLLQDKRLIIAHACSAGRHKPWVTAIKDPCAGGTP